MKYFSDQSEELFSLFCKGNELRTKGYRGRFAPSPSGSLHMGNLRTALISWLRARLEDGIWLLRVDDLDTNRIRSGAIDSLQNDLLWLGLDWDAPIVFQSKRMYLYEKVFNCLKHQGKLYACRCSRKILNKATQNKNQERFIYKGTCRDLRHDWKIYRGRIPSVRLRVDKDFSKKCGDLIVRRADGVFSYHLATVVDELALGINEVVRGADLAKATEAQIALTKAICGETLSYKHLPLVLDKNGNKLSKRFGGRGIEYLKSQGKNAPQVVGSLASSLGLVPPGTELTSLELLRHLKKEKTLIKHVFKN